MSIRTGDRIPEAVLTVMSDKGPLAVPTTDWFAARKVVLVSVPGAFTPTCTARHLPGFVQRAGEFFDRGIAAIGCMAVNDVYVMDAWGRSVNAAKIDMLADGNGEFTAALGMELDASAFGMGMRSQRFALVAEDGLVTALFLEKPGEFRVSSAEHVLANI